MELIIRGVSIVGTPNMKIIQKMKNEIYMITYRLCFKTYKRLSLISLRLILDFIPNDLAMGNTAKVTDGMPVAVAVNPLVFRNRHSRQMGLR
jgi:hypothetical protein